MKALSALSPPLIHPVIIHLPEILSAIADDTDGCVDAALGEMLAHHGGGVPTTPWRRGSTSSCERRIKTATPGMRGQTQRRRSPSGNPTRCPPSPTTSPAVDGENNPGKPVVSHDVHADGEDFCFEQTFKRLDEGDAAFPAMMQAVVPRTKKRLYFYVCQGASPFKN